MAIVAVSLLYIALVGQKRSVGVADSSTQIQKMIKSIRFFDSDQNEVISEALCYNAASMETTWIQCFAWDALAQGSMTAAVFSCRHASLLNNRVQC